MIRRWGIRSVQRPFPAYQGDEPYVFVTYAHDDAAVVYPEISRLKDQGFNIWYDEGIGPGSSWRDEIALSLSQCSALLFFVSPRSVVSENCEQELNFALSRERKMLCVHLEPTDLPPGMELSLSTKQAIVRADYPQDAYEAKLQASLRERLPTASPLLSLDLPGAIDSDDAESIAILPMVNRSSDPENEYLSDGITDELIHGLSDVNGLRVASQVSSSTYKGQQLNVRRIGEELGVVNILSGSVQKAGSRVRVHVVLNRVEDGSTLWTKRYDRDFDDIFEVQDEVARQVVDALKIELGSEQEQVIDTGTSNAAAYSALLLGRYESQKDTVKNVRNAVRHYDEAIRLDGSYKAAYRDLLFAYLWLQRQDPENSEADLGAIDEAVARLDALDPKRALPMRYRLDTLLRNDVREPLDSDAAMSTRDIERACDVVRNPEDYEETYTSEAVSNLGMHCKSVGLYRAHLEMINDASFEGSWFVAYTRAHALAALGQFDAAIELCGRALELEPSANEARSDRTIYLARTGQYEAAKADLEVLNSVWGARHFPAFCYHYWKDDRDEATAGFEWLERRRGFPLYYKASCAMMLGDVEKGFGFLEEAVQRRDLFVTSARFLNEGYFRQTLLDELEAAPRYQAVLAAGGIDDAAQGRLIEAINGLTALTGITVKREEDY